MSSATVVVQFGQGESSSGHLSAELDSRPSGLNGGRSSFNPGETAYILVYKTGNVVITGTDVSAGSLSAQGTATVAVSEEVQFAGSNAAQIQKPCKGATLDSVTWLGRNLGALALAGDRQTVSAASSGVAVAKVDYQAEALVYAIAAPSAIGGETDFSILVLIQGETT